ncbi:MAG TPA: DUF945 domain-containing protein [Chromatiales bacterium]|nr:DUF945 domain-containing protein [Chromatiales bacterium]
MGTMIDIDALRDAVPAVAAGGPDPERSPRYGFISTQALLEALAEHGWLPREVHQVCTRDPQRRPYARHVVRLRQAGARLLVGEVHPELVLLNAHDGSAAFRVYAGLYRLVCSNGFAIEVEGLARVRVRHTAGQVEAAVAQALEVARRLPSLAERIERWRAIGLAPALRERFAQAAIALRWPHGAPVGPREVLTARRIEDMPETLWHVYNRVQENLLRGGMMGRSRSGRPVRVRPLRSAARTVALDVALWRLAEQVEKEAA